MDNDEKKSQFHEALAFLVESANINSGVLTIDEIKDALKDLIDDDSMYQLVYNYLLENKITIQGYTHYTANKTEDEKPVSIDDITKDTSDQDDKEKNILNMYYEELENSEVISDEEELSCLNILADFNKASSASNIKNSTSDKSTPSTSDVKDSSADKNEIINKLTEKNLRLVIDTCKTYAGKGVSIADLIQEGNLGLMEGIMTYTGNADSKEFHHFLEASIINAISDAITEQDSSSRIGAHAADRANELDRASVALSKELDRTPTLEELAKYLSLPEDEVERVMKMSINALNAETSAETQMPGQE